jgi:hypothetical protein
MPFLVQHAFRQNNSSLDATTQAIPVVRLKQQRKRKEPETYPENEAPFPYKPRTSWWRAPLVRDDAWREADAGAGETQSCTCYLGRANRLALAGRDAARKRREPEKAVQKKYLLDG